MEKKQVEQHTRRQRALAAQRTPDCEVYGTTDVFAVPHTAKPCLSGHTPGVKIIAPEELAENITSSSIGSIFHLGFLKNKCNRKYNRSKDL